MELLSQRQLSNRYNKFNCFSNGLIFRLVSHYLFKIVHYCKVITWFGEDLEVIGVFYSQFL